MRLKISEQKAFKSEIEESSLNYEDFSFTKKSGWLTVRHLSDSEGFKFYRKSELEIKDNQFKTLDTFHAKWGTQNIESEEMEAILKQFNLWLNSLKA